MPHLYDRRQEPPWYRYDRRTAAEVSIDLALIEKLRKDFLTLMKNIPRVKDYKTAIELYEAFRIYSGRFKELFFEYFLNRDFKYDTDVSESDRHWYDKKLRKTGWDFYIELSPPISYSDDYYSEGARFADFERERARWSNRVKDKARAFWSDMRTFFEWYERVFQKTEYTTSVPNEDQVEFDGFHIIMEGFDQNDERSWNYFERFKQGLKIFRRRAEQVLPIMLRKMIPIRVIAWHRNLDEGGRYLGPSQPLEYTLDAFFDSKNPQVVAQVLAHEMGHHLYQTYLSEQDRHYWDDNIRGDYETIDLQKLLEQWPSPMTYADSFADSIRDSDPDLSLAVEAAHWSKVTGRSGFETREEAEQLLAEGTKFYAPKNPITAYANKNSEEAFCEAVGMLVGYGPHTVHDVVKHWLSVILPGVRTASRSPR